MQYTDPKVYEYISKQTNDPIVERKACAISGTKFAIFQSDLDFYEKISPRFNPPNPPYQGGTSDTQLNKGGKKYLIPTPTLCPEERERRRLARRNERFMFRRKCNATGKDIISMYPPNTKFPVYEPETRWGDSWNAHDYAQDIIEGKSFSEQFQELLDKVPILYMYNINSENSTYCNCCLDMRESYLVSGAIGDEYCYYGNYMDYCNYCVDNLMIFNCELCYECVDCKECYKCLYSQNTKSSKNSYFLFNCEECRDCFGCVNLINKQYCFFNQQLSKEEYEKKLSEIDLGSYKLIEHLKVKFEDFKNKFPRKAENNKNNQNCYGNNPLSDSKNCFKCFDASDLEDCKYLYRFRRSKKCYDVFSFGSPGEMLYECVAIGTGASKCIACANIESCHDCFYSVQCSHSHHLFGCNGLKNAEYCIFNKQYSKEDWGIEVAKIVGEMQETGEWGEMINPKLSVYGYNYSVAQEFNPLTQMEAEKLGYVWSNYESPEPQASNVLKSSDIADNTKDIDDSIINKVISCKESGKLFRIIKQEFDFYRKHGIPIPRLHPDTRYQNRLKQRPARNLYLRKCDKPAKDGSKTGKEIISVYPPDAPFPVYSEDDYDKEVYG